MITQYLYKCCYDSTDRPWYKFGWFRKPVVIFYKPNTGYTVPKHEHTNFGTL